MKTKAFFLGLLFTALSVTNVLADNGTGSSNGLNPSSVIRTEIEKAVGNSFSTEGTVKVTFTVENNKINVVRIVASDKVLENEVKSKLSRCTLTSDLNLSGVYSLNLKFVDAYSNARDLASK
jgi:hypothetical protein